MTAAPSETALETSRLRLRTPLESDAPALSAYFVRNEERFARWEPARSADVERYARSTRWWAAERAAQRGLRSWLSIGSGLARWSAP